jgi:hypothetical protein
MLFGKTLPCSSSVGSMTTFGRHSKGKRKHIRLLKRQYASAGRRWAQVQCYEHEEIASCQLISVQRQAGGAWHQGVHCIT